MGRAPAWLPVLAACLSAACAQGVAPSPSPGRDAPRGLSMSDVVAGVPAAAMQPPAPPKSRRIVLRPTPSLPRGPRPLVVVDGRVLKRVPASLEPNAIVKLHILKNPAATKRYGMRAAGGAVLITTRSD
jgi:hypothetical protein